MRFVFTTVLLSVLSVFTGSSVAHDFWLRPSNFHAQQAPAEFPVKFMVGHANDVSNWALSWDRVVALRSYSANSYRDQVENLMIDTPFEQKLAKVKIQQAGTHILGFESYHSFSDLAAEKFNDYAQKEGLSLVIEERNRLGQSQMNGREIYSRKAKTILQVGETYSDNVLRAIGHMLEIVPLHHPYQLQDEKQLAFRVLFRGKPLENALIDMAPLAGSSYDKQSTRTDENGIASFQLEQQGSWIVNVIWAVPNIDKRKAEFETYFTSLTFGYD